jgi:hypothetical protein
VDGTSLKLVPRSEQTRESPFDALLRAVEQDPHAAEGLALAYAAMRFEEREALVSTVVRDAEAAGRSPAPALALLLAVEEDRMLARLIAAALVDAGPMPSRREGDGGWAWGGDVEGGVAVARHLHGSFVEVLSVTWEGGAIRGLRTEPLAQHERISDVRRRLGVPEAAESLGLREAIDRLAQALWRTRREGGALPEGLHRLADLFGPY